MKLEMSPKALNVITLLCSEMMGKFMFFWSCQASGKTFEKYLTEVAGNKM